MPAAPWPEACGPYDYTPGPGWPDGICSIIPSFHTKDGWLPEDRTYPRAAPGWQRT